jgi:hypothetical protein
MDAQLVRALIEGGGAAGARCLAWLVEGAQAEPEPRFDVVWPSPVAL